MNEKRQKINDKKFFMPELRDEEWLSDLCFLVNIVNKLNEINILLQGKDNLIVDTHQFPLLKEFKKSKCNNYIKYAKEIR